MVAGLEAEGIRCWVAPRDITPGTSWGEAIVDAISGSKAMALVLSSNSNASRQVIREVERAVANGVVIVPFRIEGWYDCGKPETLLETNRTLLDRRRAKPSATQMRQYKDTVILPPVSIHPSARIRRSIIGPHVDVAEGAQINHSIISDSIIASNASVSNLIMAQTIIGNDASASGVTHQLNVGDNSEINLA